ncbi:ATP-dependent DNA ligase [Agromyces sp. PvR057]|uniref:DUF7882 family protein n=1 Tax=Agromyces sp. PvR057 TaxID=3156403 RepID=UPI000E2706C3
MGKFIYETLRVDFEDRVLAHLQHVIGAKLRRGESFHFSWRDDASIGNGRTTIWMHPSAMIVYKYYGSRPPSINRAWIEALSQVANSGAGLHLVPEPADGPTSGSDS